MVYSHLAPTHSYIMGNTSGSNKMADWPPKDNSHPLATFAGGCFWSVELGFQRQPGVVATAVGYTAGHKDNPTYEEVCTGSTGHAEAVQLTYNPQEVSYQALVELLFSRIDPTARNRQGGDVGTQYRSGVYYHNDEQKQVAEAVKAKHPGAVTEVLPATTFWPAEEDHQQYLEQGGRFGRKQSARKACSDPIRCYG